MKTIDDINVGIVNEIKFKQAFCAILDFIDKKNWSGACYPSVAVLFAVCKKLGIEALPCIGEAGICGCAFDHSWLLVNNKIFDAAIIYPLNETYATGPIFNSFDLYEQAETTIKYGVHFSGLDSQAKFISTLDLYTYINSAPDNLLFKLISIICGLIGEKITKQWLKENMSNCFWNIVG